jgi:hypothetical protein
MDNFKLGFGNKFSSQLGGLGGLGGAVGGAVAQPQSTVFGSNMKLGLGNKGEVETSNRKSSNLLLTPSSKGNKQFDDDDVDEFENN